MNVNGKISVLSCHARVMNEHESLRMFKNLPTSFDAIARCQATDDSVVCCCWNLSSVVDKFQTCLATDDAIVYCLATGDRVE